MLSDDEPHTEESWWDELSTAKSADGSRGSPAAKASLSCRACDDKWSSDAETMTSSSPAISRKNNGPSFNGGPSEAEFGTPASCGQQPFWQMTRGEFHEYKWSMGERDRQKINQEFKNLLAQAVSEGKPVDPRTLAEYPDLKTARKSAPIDDL